MALMRALAILAICLPLNSCDRESSRKLGEKVGALSYESSRNTEEFIKGSMEATKAEREKEHGPTVTTEQRLEKLRQDLEKERRAKDKGFPGHARQDPYSSKGYQGFPGHQK